MEASVSNINEDKGYIFFWCKSRELYRKINTRFDESTRVHSENFFASVRCYAVEDHETKITQLSEILSEEEQQKIKILFSYSLTPSMNEFGFIRTIEQFNMEASARWLCELLVDRRYKPLMQPIVNAHDTQDVMGYEFLFRGLYPDGRVISAPYMFGTAEKLGMLYPLDLAAGEVAAIYAKKFDIKERVFINVLPESIKSEEAFTAWLSTVTKNFQYEKNQLVFELVESQEIPDVDTMQKVVELLHDHGVQFALDDFGTGFNNLVTLTQVRPDYVKIDKSLTDNIMRDPFKWNLLANIVDAAKQVGTKVIAEGVEDEETYAILKDVDVDYMQGYYFGYPSERPIGYNED
ncbi:EAL domain-containing protein [Kordiimonas sp. SCSIO 12610]|uniref:EAL domain-containing protein n=1 Tax=Kordiimonas sp. SCSIO 12610 TaxID=2829597 RepID=UPI00210DA8EE|nr:EAL domain-containing protein [Kordiimonas sp. SCSIO 12610]UTW56792.1 EAL domain-containing protein [Kordiimonas sp. SCSIO 12610]